MPRYQISIVLKGHGSPPWTLDEKTATDVAQTLGLPWPTEKSSTNQGEIEFNLIKMAEQDEPPFGMGPVSATGKPILDEDED